MEIINNAGINSEHIRQALELDCSVYGAEYHLAYDRCVTYYRKNPYIYSMLLDGGRVVGYLNFSPVTPKAYERLRGGELDTFISENDIMPLLPGIAYDIYLSSIVVAPAYRGRGYAEALIADMLSQWKRLHAEYGVCIERVVADAISPGGRHLCEKLGMRLIGKTLRDTLTYEFLCKEAPKTHEAPETLSFILT